MSADSGKAYKDTIILPKTAFAMKADLARREPDQLARWKQADIYGRIRAARKDAPRFILHDGPPYATGDLHVGTGLNKVLKDFVVRYKTMRGFDSPYRPGWDCHGLPIEHRVAQELGDEIRRMTTADVRARCLDYAMKFFRRNREDFSRLLIFGQWDRPYLTVSHDYEAGVLDLFAELVAGGYVYRALSPIHWCINCQTALAEAELEYEDISSPSIYVRFPLIDDAGKAFGAGSAGKPTDLLIWTTTPWTLPANMAIAVHPQFDYVLVEAEDREGERRRMVLAEGLLDAVSRAAGLRDARVIGRCKGDRLEGLTYRHVFMDRVCPVVLADYVTLEDGTGCVHTAPGHGREDFLTGKSYGLEPVSPVDKAGRFTDQGGPFVGQQVFQADPNVVGLLDERRVLLSAQEFTHSYPHCWRCHQPVIFRSTEQWFVNVEHRNLRNRLLDQVERVKWIPEWGKARIAGMITSRPDWCISRQRAWGVPIPGFYCAGCGALVLDADLVRHVRDLFAEHGSDYWFTHEAGDLLGEGTACPGCGGAEFRKENDIFDVWFESGSSHWSVLRPDEQMTWPCDLYLEGSDQHRGWFQLSLILAMCARDQAPYKAVLTHGFIVDADGRKMSKSAGNFISVSDAVEVVGADIFRLWVAASNFRDDVNTSVELMKNVGEVSYRRIRNTLRFMLGNLHDFDPARDAVAPGDMPPMDRWAVMQANRLHEACCRFYDEYLFHRVFGELFGFCDATLSAFYLDSLKDRLYCDGRDSPSRRSAQTAVYHCLSQLIQLLAPICPFTAEEAFAAMPHKEGSFAEADSVHLLQMAPVPGEWFDAELADDFARLFKVRDDVLVQLESLRKAKAIGNSLDARVALSAAGAAGEFLAGHLSLLPAFFNVSEVALVGSAGEGFVAGTAEPGVSSLAAASPSPRCERCWRHLDSVGQNADHPTLCARCVEVIKAL